MSEVTLENFAWSILNEFEHLSRNRLHTIAFLCEHEYYQRTGEQLTDTSYREYLSSVYAEDLDEVLHDQKRLSIEEKRLGGEEIEVITVPVTQVVSVPTEIETLISDVVQEYGAVEDAESYAKNLVPRDISLLTELEFSRLYDSQPSIAEKIHK